jgi:DNA-binding CsgD family transcriptional regulator
MSGSNPQLTERQRECVRLHAQGQPLKAIAGLLGISQKTADEHVRRAKAVLKIGDNLALVKWAINEGLVSLAEPFFPR